MGQMREGIVKSSRQRFYKTPIVGQNRTDVGNPELEGTLPSYLTHLICGIWEDLLPIRVYRLPLWSLWNPKILPYSFPCQHAILASPIHLKHTQVGFGR
jgi:hypothetical protein